MMNRTTHGFTKLDCSFFCLLYINSIFPQYHPNTEKLRNWNYCRFLRSFGRYIVKDEYMPRRHFWDPGRPRLWSPDFLLRITETSIETPESKVARVPKMPPGCLDGIYSTVIRFQFQIQVYFLPCTTVLFPGDKTGEYYRKNSSFAMWVSIPFQVHGSIN